MNTAVTRTSSQTNSGQAQTTATLSMLDTTLFVLPQPRLRAAVIAGRSWPSWSSIIEVQKHCEAISGGSTLEAPAQYNSHLNARQSYHIISSWDRLSINTRPSSADWVSSLEIDGGLRDDASRFQVLPASANRAAGDTDAAPSRTLFLLRVWRLKAPEPRRTRRPADQQTGLFGAGRQLRFSTSQKRRRQLRFTPLTPLRSCSAVLALLGSQISIIPQATSECSTAKVALS
ncbi:hypothetical protein AOLI_G00244470 [Acnodon oligacanthus]